MWLLWGLYVILLIQSCAWYVVNNLQIICCMLLAIIDLNQYILLRIILSAMMVACHAFYRFLFL